MPLQVLNKEPDLENYFILAAIGSRRPKNCLLPFSQLEGLVSHHRDILITILYMTIITISCSAMIETLEECVQSIEATGAKVRFSSFLQICFYIFCDKRFGDVGGTGNQDFSLHPYFFVSTTASITMITKPGKFDL